MRVNEKVQAVFTGMNEKVQTVFTGVNGKVQAVFTVLNGKVRMVSKKVDRKMIESAVVAGFALVVVITAAAGSNGTVIVLPDTKEEAPVEDVLVASREKADVTLVAAPLDMVAPEGTQQPEVSETAAAPVAQGQAAEVSETAEAQAPEAEVPVQAPGVQMPETEAPVQMPETEAPVQAPGVQMPETTAPEVVELPVEELVIAPIEKAAAASVEIAAEEPVSEWASRLMPNVEEFLNIRTEPNAESEPAGKLYKGAAADILERGEEWTKISSGSVEGYVKNEFCVFDQEAEALAHEMGTVYATALTGGVRVRREPGTGEDVEICDVLEEGKKIKVATDAEAPEGWVAVISSDSTAYVSAEFVSVELELGKAISIEEEREAIRKAEEERKAKEKAASQKQASRSQKAAVAASYDDVTLLGALIQCEAGGECYEGQLAVGAVVMNRVRSGWAGSVSGVIYQSGQFTPASSGSLASRLERGVSSSCLQAAQEAINGVDNVGGATYFRSTSSGQSGIVIGNHVFF